MTAATAAAAVVVVAVAAVKLVDLRRTAVEGKSYERQREEEY